MNGGAIFIGVLALISFLVAIGVLIWIYTRESPFEIPLNSPIVKNYNSFRDGGYEDGLELKTEQGKNGRILCHYFAKDEITKSDWWSVRPIPQVQTSIVEMGKRVVRPPGPNSKRTHVEYLPKFNHEMPKHLQASTQELFGRLNAEISATNALIEANKRIEAMNRHLAFGTMDMGALMHIRQRQDETVDKSFELLGKAMRATKANKD